MSFFNCMFIVLCKDGFEMRVWCFIDLIFIIEFYFKYFVICVFNDFVVVFFYYSFYCVLFDVIGMEIVF